MNPLTYQYLLPPAVIALDGIGDESTLLPIMTEMEYG